MSMVETAADRPASERPGPVWAQVARADLPLREALRDEVPYGAPQIDVPVQLNVNENPYPPSEQVVADIAASVAEAARTLNRYPDRELRGLRADLATYLLRDTGIAVPPEQIWVANGSNEVLQQVLQAFGGTDRTALSFAPSYAMYPEYARNTLTRWVTGHRREDFSLDLDHARELVRQHDPSVLFLTSPNNPTGTALPLEQVEALLAVSTGVVVVDEAYAEFRRSGAASAVELLPRHPRLVVSRTMSKAFAAAGARVGYLASSRAVVDALRVVRLPYHLSAVTQAVARAALRHADELLGQVQLLRAERDALVQWLRDGGFQALDSDANFVLFGRFEDRRAVWEALVAQGVLIREVGPPGWLRVSVGTPAEMAAFRTALTAAARPTEDAR